MRKLRFAYFVIMMLFYPSGSLLQAQTYQYIWHFEFTEADPLQAWCLNHPIAGYFDYHITFHVNPKTGIVEKQHNNIVKSECYDLITGEKLHLIDTGNDGLNYWGNWYFWNDAVGADLPITNFWPINGAEGSMVAGSFKYVGKGGPVATLHWIHQIHINANGEVVVDNYKENADCN